jgi:CRISPR-associated protein Cmr2
MSINHWQLKLAAWTHDPAEKALILMRDRVGHEGGTVKALQEILFGGKPDSAMKAIMEKADHWASAADRPNFPGANYINREGEEKESDSWSRVRFYNDPVLVHPLSGENYRLDSSIKDIGVDEIKEASLNHFTHLIQYNKNQVDEKRSALAFWRFGPHIKKTTGLTALWELLPADTRVPDHTIWSHLDLTAAFASSMQLSSDSNPALLSMSFGPVQDFIAQARSTSDLWAGSHLLSRMVWEGLTTICEEVGPDAVVFPQLRGVALVDAWLYQDIGLPRELFDELGQNEWLKKSTDENPLFSAALPNKFMAIVPASQAKDLAERITARVRDWVQTQTQKMLEELLKAANIPNTETLSCWQQLKDQLEGFPEIHWASVSWELISRNADDNKKADPQQLHLKEVAASFIPEGESFLDKKSWKLLSKEIVLNGGDFYVPNPGMLYGALFDLLDRVGAAAKVARPFKQLKQAGYRCTLTGEHEWLTTERAQLILTPAKRKDVSTLWNTLAAKGKYGIKKGEHLGAIGMFKRLWPSQFSIWMSELLDVEKVNRFVVSTHTLALASSLQNVDKLSDAWKNQAIAKAAIDGVTLPRRLAKNLSPEQFTIAKGIPALIESLKESSDDEAAENLLASLEAELKRIGGSKPEAYYAMLYMDGDKMGAWLADSWPQDENQNRLQYQDTWHPLVISKLRKSFPDDAAQLDDYLTSYRPISPARHMAISGALNSFALNIARHVVEECYMGKLLYAGGDDVMAMVTVKDLFPCMLTLRLAYSGVYPLKPTDTTNSLINLDGMKLGGGHAYLKKQKQLLRVMGNKATASMGAVIAHHTAPMAYVRRQLMKAEKDSKNTGRDAFAIRVLKRGGGAEHLELNWLLQGKEQNWEKMPELENTSMGLLLQLRDQLAGQDDLSRRAAFIVNTWLPQLPDPESDDDPNFVNMIETSLQHQLNRQGGDGQFAKHLVSLAGRKSATKMKENLRNIFATAEFFAREGRANTQDNQ